MAKPKAMPQQISLFDMDSPLHGKVRGERSIMHYPFFALSKNPHMERIEWRRDNVSIEIRPSDTGVATMWDKEILLYVASLIAQAIADGQAAPEEVTFAAHDYFRVTGVERPSTRDYRRFAEARGVDGGLPIVSLANIATHTPAPREFKPGDRVTWGSGVRVYEFIAQRGGVAIVWDASYGSASPLLSDLRHVDESE